MPNRIVRDGALTSERINQIAKEPAVEITYRRVLSVVDDFGRFSAHPSILRAAIYPLMLDAYTDADITKHLEQCAGAGLIRLYRVEGKPYLEILNFNQRTRAMRSKYPPPDGFSDGLPPSEQQAGAWRDAVTCQSNDRQVDSA